MEFFDAIFVVVVVIFSAVIHEVMHGVAANSLGDPTARYAGRLTLNPLKHLDPFGSVILPGLLALSQSPFLFGWALPVPYNPYNLKQGRFSEAIVAGAGPLSNLTIAALFGIVLQLGVMPEAAQGLLFTVVVVNVMLFLFNLIPIPPLDGSKILSSLLPTRLAISYGRMRSQLESSPFAGMALVVLVVILFGKLFVSVVYTFARLLAGM
ncbi:site-2 protease family protein [bacterium]|nr:site-2 protease family protein [bacterium]